ncbi:DUF7344 domain-containing protein [Haladaptatus caseinilyticus]|uniref:DUF7344 domain-containing protein n=1 Tax=Haladaptatus caseinilyticus TaxID=2993314 RepID=UPI00224ABC1B|nr:hypothetical protein [Haladaptatus caseinilyticus]
MRDDQRNDHTDVRAQDGAGTSLKEAVGTFGVNALLRLPSEVYETLASEHRRAVLGYGYEVDSRTTVGELATHLVTTDVEADEHRARVALRHNHLPKLAEQGFVEWTPRGETVVFGHVHE